MRQPMDASIRFATCVRIIRHRRNLGGGVALTGLRYARGRLILQSDADGTYPCDRVLILLGLVNADMVIGARLWESATDWRLIRAPDEVHPAHSGSRALPAVTFPI